MFISNNFVLRKSCCLWGLSAYLSICLSAYLSICLSVCLSVCLSIRFFLTAVAVFRRPNFIPFWFSIDLVLNFLLSWLLVLLPSTFFLDVLFSLSPVVHEVMCENTVEPERPQKTRWLVRIACWKTGYRHTPRIRNTYCFPQQQWLRERAPVLRYTYIACLVNIMHSNQSARAHV